MLPDINTNDRQVGEERILVRSLRNLQLLGRRVDTLIAHAKHAYQYGRKCESDITVVCNHDDDHVIAKTITNQIEKESASIGFETWGQRTYDPAPARSLKAKGRSVELFDKVIKSTVLLLDGL